MKTYPREVNKATSQSCFKRSVEKPRCASCTPVGRQGISALAMTRWGKECRVPCNHCTPALSLRGGRGSDRRGNPSCLEDDRTGLSVRFQGPSGSPRASSLRDDKVGGNAGCSSMTAHPLLSLRGGRRGNASCLEDDRMGLSVRFQGHSGSPRASSPRDDKVCEGRPRDEKVNKMVR